MNKTNTHFGKYIDKYIFKYSLTIGKKKFQNNSYLFPCTNILLKR